MTSHYTEGDAVAASPVVSTAIDNVDAFARRLYRRARNGGSEFQDVAAVVRDLHTILKHLKIEAEDPESLLNCETSAVYKRQVTPILEDAEYRLKELDTILEKHSDDGANGPLMNDSDKGWTILDNVEIGKIDIIRSELIRQKDKVTLFLDTIQLHNDKSRKMIDTTSTEMEAIKDKVDAIASRICQRKNSGFSEDDEELWEQFRDALEAEGFSRDVLRKNQTVLRAYIRQLDEQVTAFGGSTPSVRGFLEHYDPHHPAVDAASYPDYSTPEGPGDGTYYELATDNEKFFPSMRMERLQYDDYHHPAPISTQNTDLSYDRQTSDDNYSPTSDSMALISTRDLMALDKRDDALAVAMGRMHTRDNHPSNAGNYTTMNSQSQRYLPSASQPALIGYEHPTGDQYEYEHDAPHDAPPRYIPSLPAPPLGNGGSPPPVLHYNSTSAPSVIGEHQALPVSGQKQSHQDRSRLGPDSQGREIPLDAKWTRIRRSLISPEILAQEGYRYEARPDFVAVLGQLTKEQVVDLAQKSADIRSGRRGARPNGTNSGVHGEPEKKERRPEDRYHPDKYRNWDVIEGQKDRNGGPAYVVNPNDRHRANSAVSSVSDLWDSTDYETSDGASDIDDRYREFPSSYPPPSHPHSAPYHHTFPARNGSKASSASVSEDGDEKGTKAYPFIVSPPNKDEKAGPEKTSPSATVLPKPILKNKNDDPHVRFDPEPQIFDESSSSVPRNMGRRDRDEHRDRERDKVRAKDRDRDRDRDRDKRYRSDRYLERERHPERYAERDRDRDRRQHGSSRHYSTSSSSRRDDGSRRNRGEDRDRDRATRRKSRGETLRAVGIGGAAASLLSVLTEAAVGI
ncbi:hypothetical protein GGR57DRAFT_16592 [Xylariaceae sp. FL1272]|nr:hypothetical protein GGR57DRAFT_16592 [Xylariaceae sp. FL1272]